jgi:SpoVK/Ycf46/Vps4 family AAA+-type ATPase
LNIPLILVRLDEVISSYLGKTGKNIKDIFSLVEKYECILFFDELDAIGKNRNDHQELGELKRVVTVFLQNLDIATIKGLIIGATNHPNIIDLALRRRFDTLLSIHVPTKKERETIFFASLLPQAKTVLEQQKIPLQEILPELTGSYIKKIADHINRTCIIEDTYDSIIIIKAFFESINSKIGGKATSSTKTIAKALYNNKFETKDIASIMSKPYTTVRDRVLATN